MDLNKLTKKDLIDIIKAHNKKPEQKDFDDVKQRNKELVQEIFDKNKRLQELEKQITQQETEYGERIRLKDEQYVTLSTKFNDLAALFDEHIKGFDDVIATNRLFLRTMGNTKAILESKIKKFNGSDEGGTN